MVDSPDNKFILFFQFIFHPFLLSRSTLFWTNQINTPRIERISFPNTNKTTVIKDRLKKIIAITVDQDLDLLVWFDLMANKIEYSSLDGYSRRTLYQEDDIHPLSIAAYDKYLFWIEKDKKSVEKIPLDLNHGRNKQTIFIKDHSLTDIIAVPLMLKTSSHLYCNVSIDCRRLKLEMILF